MQTERFTTRRDVLRTIGGGLVGGGVLLSSPAAAQSRTYRAALVPGIDEDARGRANFTLLDDEIRFAMTARQLDGFEMALLLAGTGDVGTEAEVILNDAGRVTQTGEAVQITGTITDDEVAGGDPTVADLVENIENGEDPRVWVFVDSDDCGVVPSGACIPGLGLRGGLEPAGRN